MTRLAGSSWEIWEDILATNRDAIGAALDDCAERLRAMRADLTGEVTRKTFESGAGFSARLRR